MRTQISTRADHSRPSAFYPTRRNPACPHCSDRLLAPTYSEFVVGGEIRHYWSCETCGLVSTTSIDASRH